MRFVLVVIVVREVRVSTVASVLNPKVLPESNEKRIERFFKKVELENEGFAKSMLVRGFNPSTSSGWVYTILFESS